VWDKEKLSAYQMFQVSGQVQKVAELHPGQVGVAEVKEVKGWHGQLILESSSSKNELKYT
jgi:hypothetical protein